MFYGVFPAVDEGVIALLCPGCGEGTKEGELCGDVGWVSVRVCLESGNLCGGIE